MKYWTSKRRSGDSEDDELPCVIGESERDCIWRGSRRSVGSSFHRQGAAYRKKTISDFLRKPGRWTSESDRRWRMCVVTRLNRNQVSEEMMRLWQTNNFENVYILKLNKTTKTQNWRYRAHAAFNLIWYLITSEVTCVGYLPRTEVASGGGRAGFWGPGALGPEKSPPAVRVRRGKLWLKIWLTGRFGILTWLWFYVEILIGCHKMKFMKLFRTDSMFKNVAAILELNCLAV